MFKYMGFKNLKANLVRISFLCSLLILNSCTSVQHVFIENNTNNKLLVLVTLNNINGEQILEMNLGTNDSDGWRYETSQKKELDERLVQVVIKIDDRCETILNREKLTKLIKKDRSWVLAIDEKLLSCNYPP